MAKLTNKRAVIPFYFSDYCVVGIALSCYHYYQYYHYLIPYTFCRCLFIHKTVTLPSQPSLLSTLYSLLFIYLTNSYCPRVESRSPQSLAQVQVQVQNFCVRVFLYHYTKGSSNKLAFLAVLTPVGTLIFHFIE